jgi:hypothetical protein
MYRQVFVIAAIVSGLFSCKKEQTPPSVHDGVSIVVEDLAGDTGASMNEGVDGKEKRPFFIFLYNLRDKRQLWVKNAADSAQWLSSDWDLAFTGTYNSTVYAKNGSDPLNPGYGTPARSSIVMVDKPYAQVTEAPDDAVFAASSILNIGWLTDDNTSGWFTYSTTTHLMQPVKSRTYVMKLPGGKYAKLELLNIYKGNPPAVTDLHWPAPYLTFRYYVQEDGSRNLSTK